MVTIKSIGQNCPMLFIVLCYRKYKDSRTGVYVGKRGMIMSDMQEPCNDNDGFIESFIKSPQVK